MDLGLLFLVTTTVKYLVVPLLLVGAAWASWLLFEDVNVRRKYRFPPIVPGLPLVGNIFQMPKSDQGPYLKRLGEKYGEM